MGSLGIPELIVIFVVALLLFGPRKLPEIGRSLGKALGEFKRASNDLKRSLEEEVAAEELRQVGREVKEASKLTPVSARPAPSTSAPQAGPQPTGSGSGETPRTDPGSKPLEPK